MEMKTIELPELPAGQLNAGLVMQDGKPSHWLILLPEAPDRRLNFKDANAWAESIGGALPNRQEQTLLFANLKEHFEPLLYWSGEEYQNAGCSTWSWSLLFSDGTQLFDLKRNCLKARAVRRIYIQQPPSGD